MDFEKEFPARYWINLGRRQERRFETEWQLEKAGITAERFAAVDARFVRKNRGYESAGRYALALSQRLVIRKAMLAGAAAVLGLEDDVIFHPDLLARLEEIELPADWGIFYLGCAHRKRPNPVGKGLVKTPYALDTHAFAVRAPYFKQVMSALDARKSDDGIHPLASDWFLANTHATIPTYACYPNLAWQAVAESDLAARRYSNYTSTGEQYSSAGEIHGLQGEMWGAGRWREASLEEETLQTQEAEKKPPRLGLLFLTRGDVNLPEVWEEFVKQGGGDMRVFAHTKDHGLPDGAFLHGKQIAARHETGWGDISLVRAMMALLKEAMADASLTHFVFLSESCVPVKPWQEIRRRLRLDPRSMIGMVDSTKMKEKHRTRLSAVSDLPDRVMRLHSQWSLLDREAAECVTEYDFTERFTGILAPDEHYIGTVLMLRGYSADKINQMNGTWAKWSEVTSRPESVDEVGGELAGKLAAFPGFFARKFPTDSRIGELGLHRI